MTDAINEKVPIPTLERLATYLRFLIDLEQSDVDTISSAEVERQTGINAAQFRKDLSHFYRNVEGFGKPGVGYNVQDLKNRITRILKIDREQSVILVGAGNLGSALVGYPGLQEHRLNLVAVFDNNPDKIGQPLWDLEIQDAQQLKAVNSELGARIAILAVPATAAQKVAEIMVAAGIHAILNFAPVLLRVPENVFVRNVSFLQELAVLSYHLSSDLLADVPTHLLHPGADDYTLPTEVGIANGRTHSAGTAGEPMSKRAPLKPEKAKRNGHGRPAPPATGSQRASKAAEAN